MKKKNLQGGFAPLLIIAIIAILAIGGGAYVVKKNKEAKNLEGNVDTQANVNADVNANVNANLGVNAKAKTSLRSLLALGKSTMCTFTSASGGTSTSGTVYLGADGDMHGMFETKTGTQTAVTSHMIVKDGVTYAWTGTQGVKMNLAEMNANTSTEMQANKYADFDKQGDYKCSPWVRDDSQFTLPASVKFMDLNALLKLNTGVKINGSGY